MRPTVFQRAELRDENNNIVQQGTYGKGSALSNSTNDAWIDYVMNNLEALYGLAKDEVVPVSALPASGDMNKTYLLTTTGVCYRWDGTEWIEISSSEAVGRAEAAADLAEEWATKTSGTVDGTEYSAKYYSNVSKDWANKLNATVDGSEYSAKHYAGVAEGWAEDAEDTAEDIADHLAQIDQNTGGVSANSKRIGNIEKLLQGNLYDYQTDSTSAYTKSVPAGAMPYAGLEKLGGKTIVMNQLVKNGNFANTSYWGAQNGTISASDNVLEFVCGSSNLQPFIENYQTTYDISHTFYISADFKQNFTSATVSVGLYGVDTVIDAVNFPVSATNVFVHSARICKGSSGTNSLIRARASGAEEGKIFSCKNVMVIDLTLMFGVGNEPSTTAEFEAMFPASYYPYNAGTLLSAGVTEVESVGRNLLNPDEVVQGSINGADGSDIDINIRLRTAFIPVVGGETYTVSCKRINESASNRIIVMEVDKYGANKEFLGFNGVNVFSVNYNVPSNVRYVKLLFKKANNDVILPSELQEPMLVKGSNVPYTPYTKTEYPIPAEVQALEGYGWSAGSVSNYIDFERKKFVKCVDKIVLDGTQTLALTNWNTNEESCAFAYSGSIVDEKLAPDMYTIGNIVADSLPVTAYAGGETNVYSGTYNGIAIANTPNYSFYVRIRDTSLTNASAINAYLSANPITVYYELATPVETDISAYLTDDNLIQVESGGTLTFPNSNGDDYQIPVPSEEEYMIDLQEAINNG